MPVQPESVDLPGLLSFWRRSALLLSPRPNAYEKLSVKISISLIDTDTVAARPYSPMYGTAAQCASVPAPLPITAEAMGRNTE